MATIATAGAASDLAAACTLADDGHEVTELERDDAPPPPEVEGSEELLA